MITAKTWKNGSENRFSASEGHSHRIRLCKNPGTYARNRLDFTILRPTDAICRAARGGGTGRCDGHVPQLLFGCRFVMAVIAAFAVSFVLPSGPDAVKIDPGTTTLNDRK